jgi:hypothetical protein
MHMDVLDCDFLLTLAAVTIEHIEQQCVGAGELVRLAQIIAPPLERLLADHGTPIAFHGGDLFFSASFTLC